MPAIQIIGQTVTTTRVNLRHGAPSTSAPVLRKLDSGTPLSITAVITGTVVQGNGQWFQTDEPAFVWSGGCGPLQISAPAVTGTTGSAASQQQPNVVDISHGDAVTSFTQARVAGVIGVIHKATTGQSGFDPLYGARRADAAQAGLLWGAYHWGTAAPADLQVKNFLAVAQPDADTLVALDFEADPGNQMTLAGARAFLQGIEDALGRRAVLYSANTIKEALGSTKDTYFGGHRLWLAQYSKTPKVQASWDSYWLWQYTDGTDRSPKVKVPGIPGDSNGNLDCDLFMGSEEQLRAQWAS